MKHPPTCPHGKPLVEHGWLNHDNPDRPTMRMRCLTEAIEYDPHSMGPQRVREFYDWGDAAYAEDVLGGAVGPRRLCRRPPSVAGVEHRRQGLRPIVERGCDMRTKTCRGCGQEKMRRPKRPRRSAGPEARREHKVKLAAWMRCWKPGCPNCYNRMVATGPRPR